MAEISTVTRIDSGEYRVTFANGAVDFVAAPSKREAEKMVLLRHIERLLETRREKAEALQKALVIVGKAIRDGAAAVDLLLPTLPYIKLAQQMGFVARSHTVASNTPDATKYLMVALDDEGLSRQMAILSKTPPTVVGGALV